MCDALFYVKQLLNYYYSIFHCQVHHFFRWAQHGTCISKKVFLTTNLGSRAAASCSSNMFQAFGATGTKRAMTSSCLGGHGGLGPGDDSYVVSNPVLNKYYTSGNMYNFCITHIQSIVHSLVTLTPWPI